MKKSLILGSIMMLAIGAVSFGKGINNNMPMMNGNGMMMAHHNNGGHMMSNCMGGYGYNSKYSKEFEQNRIAISEKRLEIQKELTKNNPDWNKIEKLNNEIATKNAQSRTLRMRERMEYNQTQNQNI